VVTAAPTAAMAAAAAAAVGVDKWLNVELGEADGQLMTGQLASLAVAVVVAVKLSHSASLGLAFAPMCADCAHPKVEGSIH